MYLETTQDEKAVVLTDVASNELTETGKKNWLSYWKYFNRKEYCQCAEHGCTEKHQYGVLVKKSDLTIEKLFVVPVCQAHSKVAGSTLNVDTSVDIISAELSL